MSLPTNVSHAESQPFSFYLEHAAKSSDGLRTASLMASRGILRTAASTLCRGWQWLQRTRAVQGSARRLRVTETVSLGEKRFLSIVQVDDTQFLIGSSATNVHLLAQLGSQHVEASIAVRESA